MAQPGSHTALLATQCPHCQTIFRVANDQLKLRAGLVRCGACQQIFNGAESLIRIDHPAEATNQPQPSAQQNTSNFTPAQQAPVPDVETENTQSITSLSEHSSLFTEDENGYEVKNLPAHAPIVPHFAFEEIDLNLGTAPDTQEVASTPADSSDTRNEDVSAPEPDFMAAEDAAGSGPEPDSPNNETVWADYPHDDVETPAEGSEAEAAAPGTEPSEPIDFQPAPDASVENISHTEEPPLTVSPALHEAEASEDVDKHAAPVSDSDAPLADPLEEIIAKLERSRHARSEAADSITESNEDVATARDQTSHYDASDEADDEPSFVTQAKRKRATSRRLRALTISGLIVLTLCLLGQLTYIYRDQLAAHFPAAKPYLLEACAYLDCQVGLPAQIDEVALVSSELQTLAPGSDTLVLSVLLRNVSHVGQTWPHLELSLNDTAERAVVRKVFSPTDYLPPTIQPRLGFPARSEQAIKLYFEVSESTATGYQVYLFYP